MPSGLWHFALSVGVCSLPDNNNNNNIFSFNYSTHAFIVLCHPFGTFFVRVCDVTALFFCVYRCGFCRLPNMAAMSIGRIIIGAFWIIRMPSMVFDVIL